MLLTLLSVLALQTEPRFTMAAEPGDMIKAELFEMDGGLTDERVRQLLGDAVVEEDASENLPGYGPFRRVMARRSDGSLIALAGAPGHHRAGSRICRAAGNSGGTVDNGARAAQWCASFFAPPVVIPGPVLPLPRPNTP
jgi:hypothetical protein